MKHRSSGRLARAFLRLRGPQRIAWIEATRCPLESGTIATRLAGWMHTITKRQETR